MEFLPQVDVTHYEFGKYLDKKRWMSIWHQLESVTKMQPSRVLEIGPGAGTFSQLLRSQGITVETVDIDESLKPDYVAAANDLPFEDKSYDVVCAFQVLEHMPFKDSLSALNEMGRVARKNVIVSLPYNRPTVRLMLKIPRVLSFDRIYRMPISRKHHFDGEHYWEIGKKDYAISNVVEKFGEVETIKLNRHWDIADNHFHHFFEFSRI